MKNLLNKFKELNKKNLSDKLFPEYKIDKRIFWIGLIIIFSWFFTAAYEEDFNFNNQIYYSCSEMSLNNCPNPFYGLSPCPDRDVSLCLQPSFYPGETWGETPSFFLELAVPFSLLIIFLCLILNHGLYNQKYKNPRRKEDEKE